MNPPAPPLFMYSGTCGSTVLTLPHGDGLGLRGAGQLVVDVAAGTVSVRGGVPPRRRYSEWLPYQWRRTTAGRLRGTLTQNLDADARFSFPLGDVDRVRRTGACVEFDVTHDGRRRTARFNARTEAHAVEIATLLRREPLPAGIAAGAAEGHGRERFQLAPEPDTATRAYSGLATARYVAIAFAGLVVVWLVSRPLELVWRLRQEVTTLKVDARAREPLARPLPEMPPSVTRLLADAFTVTAEIEVSPEGQVTRVRLSSAGPARTKPDPDFVRSVDRAVRGWRFAPEAEAWTGSIDFTIEPALDKAVAKMTRF